jgi:acetoin utilization deacetylase AcuC-like enzyme
MSRLAFIRDAKCLQHTPPPSHPESPQRLAGIDKAFEESSLAGSVDQLKPPLVELDDLLLVHSEQYVEEIGRDAADIHGADILQIDADTYMSEGSYRAARLAAGAGTMAVDGVHNNQYESAFVAVRPPGHHASRSTAMGFCLFNNIAIAAQYARKKCGYERVAIIDWDVHHGNGTQEIFYNDPSVCFVSMHEYPAYPGTGWYSEHGRGDGEGFTLNIPLPSGTGDRGHLAAWDQLIKPVCTEFAPDLILVSAGYDAHRADPLGFQKISTAGFAMLTQRLADLSLATGAKSVCFLEGGYNVPALSASVIATMRVLNAKSAEEIAAVHVSYLIPGAASGADPITDDDARDEVDDRILDIRKHFGSYWHSLR